MKQRPFVPLYDSVSTQFSEMASELLSATKGRRLSPEKLSDLIDDMSSRYTVHVIMRFNEMLERERRAMQDDTYEQPGGAREIRL
jgi:ATP-dependent helicase/DNAse subunit B